MQQKDTFETLENIYMLTSIPLYVVTDDNKVLFCRPYIDNAKWPAIMTDFAFGDLKKMKISEKKPYFGVGDMNIFMGVIKIMPGTYVVLGPISESGYELNDVINVYGDYFERNEIILLYETYIDAGKMSIEKFAGVMSLLWTSIKKRSISAENITKSSQILPGKDYRTKQILLHQANGENIRPVTGESDAGGIISEFTDRIIRAIKCGNKYELDDVWAYDYSYFNLKKDTEFEWYIKSKAIPLISIIFRAAVSGGVVDDYAQKVFEMNVSDLTKCKNMNEVIDITRKASYDYCAMVYSLGGRKHESALADRIEQYIMTHLREKIVIGDLAKICEVSERQIYRIFEYQFKLNMSEFVHRERIKQSLEMLGKTDISINEISSYWGYASQSHFNQTFRKYMNCTPGEYRTNFKSKAK